jgi:putative hydrolase of HD superfamily
MTNDSSETTRRLAELIFEAGLLKRIQRTGYAYLGASAESVAAHSFITAVIGYVLSQMVDTADIGKTVLMCLFHDLPEARTGDLNYVQKQYVTANESKALADLTSEIPFGGDMASLITEFETGETPESKLAKDADQLALMIDMKALADQGQLPAVRWLESVHGRLETDAGKRLGDQIARLDWDGWWRKIFS